MDYGRDRDHRACGAWTGLNCRDGLWANCGGSAPGGYLGEAFSGAAAFRFGLRSAAATEVIPAFVAPSRPRPHPHSHAARLAAHGSAGAPGPAAPVSVHAALAALGVGATRPVIGAECKYLVAGSTGQTVCKGKWMSEDRCRGTATGACTAEGVNCALGMREGRIINSGCETDEPGVWS